eukprot:8278384-Karenia_brevis.AAC.1
MAAANSLVVIARMLGCGGEDADASGAYTQSYLGDPDTWISLPKYLWPDLVTIVTNLSSDWIAVCMITRLRDDIGSNI